MTKPTEPAPNVLVAAKVHKGRWTRFFGRWVPTMACARTSKNDQGTPVGDRPVTCKRCAAKEF